MERHAKAWAALAAAWAMGLVPAAAQTLAPIGCPVFHCTPQATGVIGQDLLGIVKVAGSNSKLGSMQAQGCSGDGERLACLFRWDYTPGAGAGTLKVIDATTLQPLWGSRGTPGSQELDAASAAVGQVPLVFARGRVAAGDAKAHVLYAPDGSALASAALAGKGHNLGMTPVSASLAVVSQTDGVLTLVDLATWTAVDSLVLRDPAHGGRLALVSPSSASHGVLYAVAGSPDTGRGLLFSVGVDTASRKLLRRGAFAFAGRSGASPVVLGPEATGVMHNLVLLHVPGLEGEAVPRNRLLGLLDVGAGFATAWALELVAPIEVAPTIDQASRTLFFSYGADTRVHQHRYVDGQAVAEFDLRALAGLPPTMVLNGHLASSQAGGRFTLLLSAGVAAANDPSAIGQFVMAYEPGAPALLWGKKIFPAPDAYTAAWNLAPSLGGVAWCPVVVGTTSGLTRLCDF